MSSGNQRPGVSADRVRSAARRPATVRIARWSVNVAGALAAAIFARRFLLFYLHSHRLIGVAFFVQQLWIMAVFLFRRPPHAVSRRARDWLLATAGTFGGVLLQPSGHHPQWGVETGLILQLVGLAISVLSLVALGRSFGSVAADRGMVDRGPYRVVRHPVYVGYLFIQIGYVLQSASWWNVAVVLMVTGCNVGRALVEERLLRSSGDYQSYQQRVPWRLLPGLW